MVTWPWNMNDGDIPERKSLPNMNEPLREKEIKQACWGEELFKGQLPKNIFIYGESWQSYMTTLHDKVTQKLSIYL
jgi:hypothetical protein